MPYKAKIPIIQETGVQRLVLIIPAKELQSNNLASNEDFALDPDLQAAQKPDCKYAAADGKTRTLLSNLIARK